MRHRSHGLIFCVLASIAVSGCGGGGGSSPSPVGIVTATPTPSSGMPTATPTPVPTSSSSTSNPTATPVPSLKGASVTVVIVPGQPITVPAVGGFASSVVVNPAPGTSFPAGASITANGNVGLPAGAPSPDSRRHAFVASPSTLFSLTFSFNDDVTILYSLSTTIPDATAGTLYTAETFDETTGKLISTIVSAYPATGPITFDAPAPFAVTAGDNYITEVFLSPAGTTPSPTSAPTSAAPTATPTATATPVVAGLKLFAGNGSAGGVAEYSASSGSLLGTFASSLAAAMVGADNAGDIYTFGTGASSTEIAKVAIGGSAILASYAPTSAQQFGFSVAPTGEVVVVGFPASGSNVIFDEWDPGATGGPSRTITYTESAGTETTFALGPDGTLYIPYLTASGVQKVDVIGADSSSLERTLTETLASKSATFSPNVMAASSDGTVYIGEWSFTSPDTNAGMYVFAPSGAESKVSSMDEGIVGIDFDQAGNVYVASNDTTYTGSSSQAPDLAHQLSVYTARGASLTSQIDDGAPGVGSLTVANDGTAFLTQYAGYGSNAPGNVGDIVTVHPGATSGSVLIPNVNTDNVVLFDGTSAKDIRSNRVYHASLGRESNALAHRRR